MLIPNFMSSSGFSITLKTLYALAFGQILIGCSNESPNLPFRYEVVPVDAKTTTILHVTNLNREGPGSLRWAMEHSEPRAVVFDVGGVIDLGEKSIKVRYPYLSVNGETAPSPGITLIRGGIRIETHDVRLSHLMVRPGDAGKTREDNWKPDGITIYGEQARRIIIDHCSITWAVDENIAISGPGDEGPLRTAGSVVIKNSIIAEALNNSTHPEGPHSKGVLVHDNVQGVSIINNLFAHNVRRNPYFKSNTTGIIKGNVIYNPGRRAIHLSSSSRNSSLPHSTIISNLLLYGKDTEDSDLISKHGRIYSMDNHVLGGSGKFSDGKAQLLVRPPVIDQDISTLEIDIIRRFCDIVNSAGARPWDPSSIDLRIKLEVVNRTGQIIDSQNDVGGYPGNLDLSNSRGSTNSIPQAEAKTVCFNSISILENNYSLHAE